MVSLSHSAKDGEVREHFRVLRCFLRAPCAHHCCSCLRRESSRHGVTGNSGLRAKTALRILCAPRLREAGGFFAGAVSCGVAGALRVCRQRGVDGFLRVSDGLWPVARYIFFVMTSRSHRSGLQPVIGTDHFRSESGPHKCRNRPHHPAFAADVSRAIA